ncbi:MAG TPA: MFS transporter [Anaerolineales bacterium]|nr:MFS transporter [Anaerolineales bacterium]
MQSSTPTIPQNWTRRFFTIWTGQAFSLFGSALVQFALIWWLTQRSGSATVLAIATLVGMLPQIVIGPFAGALVDRWNRRLIMILADALIAVSTLMLVYLFATDQVQIWHVYAILGMRSLGTAFHFPAMSASTALMVPEDQLTRINGLNQTLLGINGLIAPPVGALLIGILPTHNILLIDVATAILAILPLFFFTIPQPVRDESANASKPSLFQDIREAFNYIRGWSGLVAIISMALFLNFLLVPTGALLPILITKHFEKGALELGLINSAEGVGIIAGGILLSVWGGFKKKKIVTSMAGIFLLGISVMLVGVAPANLFALAVAGLFLTGLAIPITNGPIGALFQSLVRNDMQGRVMSLVNSAATAISPLGLLIAGPLSDALGIQIWFWAGGLICALIGIAGFFVPSIMNIENNKEEIPTPAPEPG